jgi:MarR family transcriptional regulator, organic hydroperoxide resistance regulator
MDNQLEKYFSTLRKFSRILMGKITNGSGPKMDFNFSQLRTIAAFKDDRAVTMKDLADNSMIKRTNMTIVVDSLIKDGLVRREIDKNDRRKVYVRLTPKGIKLKDEFLLNRRSVTRSIYAKLSEKNKKELLSSLDKVCTILGNTIDEV